MKLADLPGIIRAIDGLKQLKNDRTHLQSVVPTGSMFMQNFNSRVAAASELLSPDEAKDIIGILCKAVDRKIDQVRVELIAVGVDPAELDAALKTS